MPTDLLIYLLMIGASVTLGTKAYYLHSAFHSGHVQVRLIQPWWHIGKD